MPASNSNSPKEKEENSVTYHIYTEGPATSFQNFQTLVEVSARVAEGEERPQGVHIAWEQDNVKHLQDALNRQPSLNLTPGRRPSLSAAHAAQKINQTDLIHSISGGRVIQKLPDGSPLHYEDLLSFPAHSRDLSSTSAVGVAKPMILPQRKPGGKRGLKEGLEGSDPPPKGVKRRRKDENDDDIFRACKVCGEEAGRHSYYGGQVCASCRAFFRRSVNSGANKAYFCVKNGNCEVNSKTRKQCQYCRYRLCEDAGMKTSWVLTDTEKKLKSSEGKEGKQNRNSIDYEEVSNPSSLSGESSSIYISETELVLINELVEISDFRETSKVNDMDTTLIREIIRMVAFGSMLSEVGLAQLAGTMKLRTKNFALRLCELQQLSKQDRDEILTKNIPILIKLKISTFFNPELNWSKQLSGLLGSLEVEKLDRKLKSLECVGLDEKRLKYSQFFATPFLQTEEAEQDFCRLLNKIGSWPEDEKEYILISLILLFSPDLLVLSDRARVEQIQTSLAELLHSYLNHRHGRERGRSKFASGMRLISKCRQLHDILSKNKIDISG